VRADHALVLGCGREAGGRPAVPEFTVREAFRPS